MYILKVIEVTIRCHVGAVVSECGPQAWLCPEFLNVNAIFIDFLNLTLLYMCFKCSPF